MAEIVYTELRKDFVFAVGIIVMFMYGFSRSAFGNVSHEKTYTSSRPTEVFSR